MKRHKGMSCKRWMSVILAAAVVWAAIPYTTPGRAVQYGRLQNRAAAYAKEAVKEKTTSETENKASKITEPSELYAKAAVLMDGDSGRILFSQNGDERLPNASTTKLMTCILALECGNIEDIVTASAYAASMPKVSIGVKAGEQYYMKDLLYSLMLESHNDSAVIIAEHIAGSCEAFAEMMNTKAKEIGCKDTFFVTPNGLDGEAADENGRMKSHGTTAADLALILRYCLMQSEKSGLFREITTTPFYTFTSLNSGRNVSCYNHNTFLTMMEGAGPGKTGFTGNAGYCYAGSLESDGRTFIAALLACGWPDNKTYKWKDMKKLMNYAKDHYHYRDVCEEFSFSPLSVENGIGTSGQPMRQAWTPIGLENNTDRQMKILLRDDENVEVEKNFKTKLEAPITAGEKVGEVIYSLNGHVIKKQNIVALNTVEEISPGWCFKYVLGKFLSESH